MGCCSCIANKTYEENLETGESVDRSTVKETRSPLVRKPLSIKQSSLSSKYFVHEIIGEGAYGVVRRAVCKSTNEERAVKSLLKSFVTKTHSMFTEVEFLSSLRHPNILKVFEVLEDQRYYHIVTALCTGGELLDRILSSSSFSEEKAANYFYQVISALMHCHSNGILHRDIKPENLLFQNSGDDSPLIVIDFGLSRKHKKEGIMNRLNPYYQPPEALTGSYSMEGDIWSCGVVLYLMLGGYLPFHTRFKIKEDKLEFPEQEWGGVSSLAKNLIKSMLAREPSQRPSAYAVMHSEWVQKYSKKEQTVGGFLGNAFKRLYKFRASLRLTHAVLEFVAANNSAKNELKQLQEVFLTFDANGDGQLSREELIFGINQLELPHLKAEGIVDMCSGEFVDYSEFIRACANWHQLLTSEKLHYAFAAFDLDKSGYIDMKELKKALGGEEVVKENVWGQVMKEVDLNGDGVIDMKEFESALLARKSYFI